MKKIYTFILAFTTLSVAFAQTNPAAFDLGGGNYLFNSWPATSLSGTYPANMIFHCDSVREGQVFNAVFNYTCAYNQTARARVNGKGGDGFSFLNTQDPLSDNCTTSGTTTQRKFMGAAVLALSTLSRENIQVSWTGRMLSNTTYGSGNGESTRKYRLKLQYRTDTTTNFLDVPGALEFLSNATDTTFKEQGTFENIPAVTLPAVCNNKPYIQVRWLYYLPEIGTGTRPELGVDEINVLSVASNFVMSVTPLGPTTFCQGDSVVLTATEAAGYLWSTGDTTQSITVTSSGNYFVTGTNSAGTVSNSGTIQVTVNPAPNAVISFQGAAAICDGENVTMFANAGASYLWSTGDTTQSIVVGITGTYSVIVTYNNGCTSTSNSVDITTSTAATPEIEYNGGTGLTSTLATTYTWSLNGVDISGANGQFYEPTENGAYTVTTTNELGCSATSTPFEWNITGLTKTEKNGFKIYPNPVSDILYFSVNNNLNTTIEIFDINGKLMYFEKTGNNFINVNELTQGVYHIRIIENGSTEFQNLRFIKN